jgi:hypothetical protein
MNESIDPVERGVVESCGAFVRRAAAAIRNFLFRRVSMKKIGLLLIVLLLLLPAGAVSADVGKNPNAVLVHVTCEGLGSFDVWVTGSAGHAPAGIGIPRSVYVNGELVFEHPGRGYRTVWCEWTFDGDPNQYSGDVQIAPPGGR